MRQSGKLICYVARRTRRDIGACSRKPCAPFCVAIWAKRLLRERTGANMYGPPDFWTLLQMELRLTWITGGSLVRVQVLGWSYPQLRRILADDPVLRVLGEPAELHISMRWCH